MKMKVTSFIEAMFRLLYLFLAMLMSVFNIIFLAQRLPQIS